MRKIKKRWIVLGIVLILAVVLFVTMGLPYIRRHFIVNEADVEAIVSGGEKISTDRKIITVYFTRVGNSNFEDDVDAVSSASLLTDGGILYGNSQILAMMVQDIAGGDIYAIQTEKKYPSSYNDTIRDAREEMNAVDKPVLIGETVDFSAYDTVVLVFPLWWGTYPMPVASFLEQYDFSGTKILPIVTHGGSSFGTSMEDLKNNFEWDFGEGLAIYDDEIKEAREEIVTWLKGI